MFKVGDTVRITADVRDRSLSLKGICGRIVSIYAETICVDSINYPTTICLFNSEIELVATGVICSVCKIQCPHTNDKNYICIICKAIKELDNEDH
jgi:hypothetical protein